MFLEHWFSLRQVTSAMTEKLAGNLPPPTHENQKIFNGFFGSISCKASVLCKVQMM